MLNRISRLLRRQKGFTLVELMVVVAIIALLATFATSRVFEAITSSKKKVNQAEISAINGALQRYFLDKNIFPARLGQLVSDGYMKANTTFKNKFGYYYFYAVNDDDTPTAFVLADPLQNADETAVLCLEGQEGIVPQGREPVSGSIVAWKEFNTAVQLVLRETTTTECDTSLDAAAAPSSISTYKIGTDLVVVKYRPDLTTE